MNYSYPELGYNAVKNSLQQTYSDFSSGNGDVKANIAGKAVGEIAQVFIRGTTVKAVTKGWFSFRMVLLFSSVLACL